MAVRKKLILAFAVAVGLQIAQIVAVQLAVGRMQASVKTITDVAAGRRTVLLADDIVGSLDQILICPPRPEASAEYLSTIEVYWRELTGHVHKLAEFTKDSTPLPDASDDLLDGLDVATDELEAFNTLVTQQLQDPEEIGDQVLFLAESVHSLAEQLSILDAALDEQLHEASQRERALHNRPNQIGIAAGTVAVVFLTTFAWIFSGWFVKPLRTLSETFDRVKLDKSFHLRVPATGNDEFAVLGRAFNDLADRIESEFSARQEAEVAAQRANQAKSDFLANMSHEIRTPMTAILGFTNVFLEGAETEEQRAAANTVKRNGEYLLGLINDILDLSKIEAGKLDVERISCSPASVVADVASLMRVRANAKNLPFDVEYDGPIPESIESDPTRLRQVLINLVGNAIKFTEVGRVRIVTRFVRRADGPDCLQFNIIDTGVGMTAEQASRIFSPFSQADTSTTRKFGGTGLGLAISKRLAEIMQGDISLDSTPGKGSTFTLTIETGSLKDVMMLARPIEAITRLRQPANLTPRTNIKLDCRLLLAEDGLDNQRLISFLLKKAGADVTVAENGQVALDQVQEANVQGKPFDVILMDMQMPVMDGYTATGRLRADGHTGPIIALTAHAMPEDRRKCLDAGCDDYATKPIDHESLLAVIATSIEKSDGVAGA